MAQRVVLSYSSLAKFPDDGLRREILAGELFVTPSPTPRHQETVGKVFRALDDYARAHGGKAYVAPIDVIFTDNDVVEPDVIYIAEDRLPIVGERAIHGPPNLIVEVLSPASSEMDPGEKLELYARHQVPEYWIVDHKAKTILRHSDPRGKRYETVKSFGGRMVSATLSQFDLPVADLIPR